MEERRANERGTREGGEGRSGALWKGAEEARAEEEGPGANARKEDARDTGTARARWGDPEEEEGKEEAAAEEEPDASLAAFKGGEASASQDSARRARR